MPRKPRPINQWLQAQSSLKTLQLQIELQQELLLQVHASLPAKLAKHCSSAQVQGSALILFTDTPVWASKLRFLSPQLLSKLRASHPGIASVSVKLAVVQRQSPVPKKVRRLVRRSNVAADIVDNSKAGISSPALRSALGRLAKALREK